MTQLETCEIQVLEKGIHCAGCETRIQSVLARVPGVKEVIASHKTQKVKLTLDPGKVSARDLREKLEDLGYKTTQ